MVSRPLDLHSTCAVSLKPPPPPLTEKNAEPKKENLPNTAAHCCFKKQKSLAFKSQDLCICFGFLQIEYFKNYTQNGGYALQ